jgi:NAD(P)-dependent dehydrogenase (short-subunit alcohol dehydrogenase family)
MAKNLTGQVALVTGGSRGIDPAEDVAALVTFLATPDAGAITGAALHIDHRHQCLAWG